MKISTLALKKGRDLAGQNISSLRRHGSQHSYDERLHGRTYASTRGSSLDHETTAIAYQKSSGRSRDPTFKEEKDANRDFLLSVLDSSATKRDAKAYLQAFSPTQTKPTANSTKSSTRNSSSDNVVGKFYGPTRAVHESPKFIQHPEMGKITPEMVAPLHIALVKIRAPQTLSDDTLYGVGRTLSQLAKLGLTSTVVVDCEDGSFRLQAPGNREWKDVVIEQTDRVVSVIDAYGRPGARKVDTAIGVSEMSMEKKEVAFSARGSTYVANRKILMAPLRRGVIPVLPQLGYTEDSQRAALVKADDVVMALAREFAGFQPPPLPDADPELVADLLNVLRREVSLDRLIVLDPLGGIPQADPDRPNRHHVFLNMEQEYAGVKKDLLAQHDFSEAASSSTVTILTGGNPLSKFVETEFQSLKSDQGKVRAPIVPTLISNTNQLHLNNLELTRKVLAVLPPRTSAILTTPEEASNSGNQAVASSPSIGVGTRRKRNPLIHNLLTDKPVFSSSMPSWRLETGAPSSSQPTYRSNPTTLAKRGMAITMFPDPRIEDWQAPGAGAVSLSLKDPRIDLARLVHLIDDSFNRKLDVEAYLRRVQDRVAGVIIAGEYEGGALLTWELPPGVPDDGSEASRRRMVPYLDKFAVLKRSQGAGGVADIVFTAMVRTCFPNGVCWRSRRDNPVNKWYFERSRGTWKMQDTNWTMFWTTPGLYREENKQTFLDYEAVCRAIQPTWADVSKVVD